MAVKVFAMPLDILCEELATLSVRAVFYEPENNLNTSVRHSPRRQLDFLVSWFRLRLLCIYMVLEKAGEGWRRWCKK